MSTLVSSFSILAQPGVFLYLLRGVAFTCIISVLGVILGLIVGSLLALARTCLLYTSVDQAGAGDLPAAGVADGQGALPQQEHRQCGQPADHGGKGRAQRRARHTPAKTEHRDGLAKRCV